MRKLRPRGQWGHFLPELGLALSSLRSYRVPLLDPGWVMALGACCAVAAVTKLSCRTALGTSTSWELCPPSSLGAQFSASLPDRCGNRAVFQLVLFHCISISAAAACSGQSWVSCAEDCFGKGNVRALQLLCWGWQLGGRRRDAPPTPQVWADWSFMWNMRPCSGK